MAIWLVACRIPVAGLYETLVYVLFSETSGRDHPGATFRSSKGDDLHVTREGVPMSPGATPAMLPVDVTCLYLHGEKGLLLPWAIPTVDGRNPAPSKKPWFLMIPL